MFFPKHLGLGGREREHKKSNYFPLLSLQSLQIRLAFREATKFSVLIAVLPPASSANGHSVTPPRRHAARNRPIKVVSSWPASFSGRHRER